MLPLIEIAAPLIVNKLPIVKLAYEVTVTFESVTPLLVVKDVNEGVVAY